MKIDLNGCFATGKEAGKPVPDDALDDVLSALTAIVRTRKGPEGVLAKSIESVKFEFSGISFYPDLDSTITIVDSRNPKKPITATLSHYQAFRTGQAIPAKDGLREGILDLIAKAINFERAKKAA